MVEPGQRAEEARASTTMNNRCPECQAAAMVLSIALIPPSVPSRMSAADGLGQGEGFANQRHKNFSVDGSCSPP